MENGNYEMRQLMADLIVVLKKLDKEVGGILYRHHSGEETPLRDLIEFDDYIARCEKVLEEKKKAA